MFVLFAFLLLTAFIGTSIDGLASAGGGGHGGNIKARSYSYYDLQKQVGAMGDDFRQLITNLIGATQVVYWKKPTNRVAPTSANRRVGMKPPKHADHHQAASVQRKKKALHSDYDDLIAMDAWSFFK